MIVQMNGLSSMAVFCIHFKPSLLPQIIVVHTLNITLFDSEYNVFRSAVRIIMAAFYKRIVVVEITVVVDIQHADLEHIHKKEINS